MKYFFAFLLIFCSLTGLMAQSNQLYSLNELNNPLHLKIKEEVAHKNIVKINLMALGFKNLSLQYERILNKSFSLALSVRYMPNSSIPFKNFVINQYGNDSITKDVIENLRLNNFQFTPEFRYYFGKKGYGHGFYIAPYYRFSSFNTDNLKFEYEQDNNETNSVELSGKLSSFSGGIMIGAQWIVGKNISIDWWILGAQFGKGNGSYSATTSYTLSSSEQADLKEAMESAEIPMFDKQVEVNQNGATLKLEGPMIGIRAGLSFGIKF
jgi:hypothetical protein